MSLKYTPTFLHGIGFRSGKKFALVCGLGGMQIGTMWFPWSKEIEKKEKCNGCLQGMPFWNTPKYYSKGTKLFGFDF